MNRREFLAATAFVTAACGPSPGRGDGRGVLSAVPAAAAGIPQLVVVDGGRLLFGAYLAELLRAEGVPGVFHVRATQDARPALADVSAVIAYGDLPDAWSAALDTFVLGGGALVAILPGAMLRARVGLHDGGPLEAAAVRLGAEARLRLQIGRASCRERV